MNYTRCKSCKKQQEEKINKQRQIIEHYTNESYFYSKMSNVLFIMLVIAGGIIISLVK